MLTIKPEFTGRYALLHTGFRPFFALAGIGAALLMLLWSVIWAHPGVLSVSYPAVAWHAHEMIFGFGSAVVAGFLLTAVRNWTGRDTVTGYPLLGLALLWVGARVLPFVPGLAPLWPAVLEVLFLTLLMVGISKPVIEVRQWRQLGIVAKIALLIPASIMFYLGVMEVWPAGINAGLYTGFYILLALILTLARRVMPMFIERGLLNGFIPRNSIPLDRACLGVFFLFMIADIGVQIAPGLLFAITSSLLALVLVILHGWRLSGWYHEDIWKKPMVWVLFLAYTWIIFGFLLKAMGGLGWATSSQGTHALAVGGMGLVIVGMMSRVSLGHTGRNVNQPPKGLTTVFILVFLAACLRVIGLWLVPEYYKHWISLSQVVWVVAFSIFSVIYVPILIKARIDGQRG